MRDNLTKIGFGCGGISGDAGGYSFGAVSEKDALNLLSAALEKGFDHFDTAPVYGFGESERRLGLAFQNFNQRSKVQIATKGGIHWDQNKRIHTNNRPEIIELMLHESLKRLNTDYIDVYYIHHYDNFFDIRYALEVLVKHQEQGKILHLGLSNTTVDDWFKAKEMTSISYLQEEKNYFTDKFEIFHRSNIDLTDIKLVGYGTLDKGILSGRVHQTRTYEASDVRSHAPWWKKGEKERLKKIEKVKEIKKQFNLQSDNELLKFAVDAVRGHVDYALIGPKTLSDLENFSSSF